MIKNYRHINWEIQRRDKVMVLNKFNKFCKKVSALEVLFVEQLAQEFSGMSGQHVYNK